MKRIKSYISLLICIFMVATDVSIGIAANLSPHFDLNVTRDSVRVGEEFYLLVNIKENVGFGAMQFSVGYDGEKLLLESAALGELIPDTALTSVNTDIEGEVNFSCISLDAVLNDGTVLIVKFAAREKEIVDFDFRILAYADADGNTVDASYNDARIEINSNESAEPVSGKQSRIGGSTNQNKSNIGFEKAQDDTKPENERETAKTFKAPEFTDADKTHWAYNQIRKAVELGLFSGTSEYTFEPESPMTRAMFVTVLHRFAGKPKAKRASFSDIEDDWYTDAVSWAAENNIVNGTGNNMFSPNSYITRGEISTVLYRYKQGICGDTEYLLSFKDSDTIPDWGRDAVTWAIENGLIMGRDGGIIAFSDNATRAEAAVIFTRFLNIK